MIPERFDYKAPQTLEQAVDALGEDAVVLGGGTWVVPSLNRGELRPHTVVDLRNAGLGTIAKHDETTLTVGAMCTYADLLDSEEVATHLPLLHTMAAGITGGRQILCQGTLGGSLAAARPSSDAPAVLVALGGRIRAIGAGGRRTISAREFFVAAEQTVLQHGELLEAIEFDVTGGVATGYCKLKHNQSSWPIATAAARLDRSTDGQRYTSATVTLGGVIEVPVEIDLLEIVGEGELSDQVITAAAEFAASGMGPPWSDVLGSSRYRMDIAAVAAARALRAAVGTGRAPHWTTGRKSS